ncbi:MAG: DUF2780 domain-containing protein [Deltaproteobacteria bacterium]|nr:MAG: DUF2780 domain-containing protein [Deltaproteobacteria bacterium]
MNRCVAKLSIVTGLVLSLMLLSRSASALDTGLVSTLVDKLGVTESQAQGGSGAIFKAAKSLMLKDDYKQLSDAVPEVDALQKFVPKADDSKKSLFGSAASALGGEAGSSLGSAAGLMSSFDSLGLGKDMLGKFPPIIYDYVEKNGSKMVMESLKKALPLPF